MSKQYKFAQNQAYRPLGKGELPQHGDQFLCEGSWVLIDMGENLIMSGLLFAERYRRPLTIDQQQLLQKAIHEDDKHRRLRLYSSSIAHPVISVP